MCNTYNIVSIICQQSAGTLLCFGCGTASCTLDEPLDKSGLHATALPLSTRGAVVASLKGETLGYSRPPRSAVVFGGTIASAASRSMLGLNRKPNI